MKLDITKAVITKQGKNARIICSDAKGKFPIIALVEYEPNKEVCVNVNPYGKVSSYDESKWDLINVPQKITLYFAVLEDDFIVIYCDNEKELENSLQSIYKDVKVIDRFTKEYTI